MSRWKDIRDRFVYPLALGGVLTFTFYSFWSHDRDEKHMDELMRSPQMVAKREFALPDREMLFALDQDMNGTIDEVVRVAWYRSDSLGRISGIKRYGSETPEFPSLLKRIQE